MMNLGMNKNWKGGVMKNRRWKLKREFPVPAEFLEPAYHLREYEGKEIFLEESTHENDLCISVHCGYYFPISWLTEIKEPLSFCEWDKINRESPISVEEYNDRQDIWNACLENQKLGIVVDEKKDTEAFKEWVNKQLKSPDNIALWKAALAYARGIL